MVSDRYELWQQGEGFYLVKEKKEDEIIITIYHKDYLCEEINAYGYQDPFWIT